MSDNPFSQSGIGQRYFEVAQDFALDCPVPEWIQRHKIDVNADNWRELVCMAAMTDRLPIKFSRLERKLLSKGGMKTTLAPDSILPLVVYGFTALIDRTLGRDFYNANHMAEWHDYTGDKTLTETVIAEWEPATKKDGSPAANPFRITNLYLWLEYQADD